MSRIRLRNLVEEDRSSVYDLLGNDQVMKFIGPRKSLSKNESDDWFSSELKNPSRYVVASIESNDLLGFCGVKNIEGTLDFGYFLREKYWGQGYAKEACSLALKELSKRLDLSIVEIFIACDNEASLGVAKSLGWSFLGATNKNGERGELYGVHM